MSSLAAETDRLHVVLESTAAPSFAAETDQLHAESESSGARVCWHSGGHSAWRGRVGGLRLRRQAHSRSGKFDVDSLLSSHHVDHVHTRNVGCAHGEHVLHGARTNSCLGTRAARVNSFALHSARGNSGGHTNSYRCTYNACGGVREGTKPMSMSTRDQVGCPAVEKLASLQQAPGRLHVETWAGRDENPSLSISQVVGNVAGVCGYGDTTSPSRLLFRVTWAGQRSSEWDGLVTFGENSQVWGMVERIVPHGVVGPLAFFVFLFIFAWARHGCAHNLESGIGHC